jgi:class 3 adenylate cyclase
MKTENLAIVFVDIAGYTPRTSAQTREENVRMLKRFDGLVRPLVWAYRGRVVKTIGDAYLLIFRSPTDALLCCMAIHDRIAETDAGIDVAERFKIRSAVNVGDVRLQDNDVFGEAVNIASRIEGKAGAGEIYFSEAVYLSMTRSEVPCEEVGYTELKGIVGRVRLYRVLPTSEVRGMPFGGLALDRVRDGIGTDIPYTLAPSVAYARKLFQRGVDMTLQSFTWWQTEVRRSRTIQYLTIALLIALVVMLIWIFTPRQTPMQKFMRSIGF